MLKCRAEAKVENGKTKTNSTVNKKHNRALFIPSFVDEKNMEQLINLQTY